MNKNISISDRYSARLALYIIEGRLKETGDKLLGIDGFWLSPLGAIQPEQNFSIDIEDFPNLKSFNEKIFSVLNENINTKTIFELSFESEDLNKVDTKFSLPLES